MNPSALKAIALLLVSSLIGEPVLAAAPAFQASLRMGPTPQAALFNQQAFANRDAESGHGPAWFTRRPTVHVDRTLTRREFGALLGLAGGAYLASRLAHGQVDVSAQVDGGLAAMTRADQIEAAQTKTQLLAFIDTALTEMSTARDPDLDALKAVRQANLRLIKFDPATAGTNTAQVEFQASNAGTARQKVNLVLDLGARGMQRFLERSKTDPVVRKVFLGILIKEGHTLLDAMAHQTLYLEFIELHKQFERLTFNVNRPADRDLIKRLLAHQLEAEMVGYRVAGQWLKRNKLTAAQIRALGLNEKDPILKRAFLTAFQLLGNLELFTETRREQNLKEYFLWVMLPSMAPPMHQAVMAILAFEGIQASNDPASPQPFSRRLPFLTEPQFIRQLAPSTPPAGAMAIPPLVKLADFIESRRVGNNNPPQPEETRKIPKHAREVTPDQVDQLMAQWTSTHFWNSGVPVGPLTDLVNAFLRDTLATSLLEPKFILHSPQVLPITARTLVDGFDAYSQNTFDGAVGIGLLDQLYAASLLQRGSHAVYHNTILGLRRALQPGAFLLIDSPHRTRDERLIMNLFHEHGFISTLLFNKAGDAVGYLLVNERGPYRISPTPSTRSSSRSTRINSGLRLAFSSLTGLITLLVSLALHPSQPRVPQGAIQRSA